jgi:hypothetical protein
MDDITCFQKNGYLLSADLIAVARAGDQNLIVIGRGWSIPADTGERNLLGQLPSVSGQLITSRRKAFASWTEQA